MIKPSDINVLVACEESQAECIAFRERGFNAFSCDLQKARYNPEWHILGDVSQLLCGRSCFTTESRCTVQLDKWHLIVAHPPCTYLCKVSSVHLVRIENGHRIINPKRLAQMKCAADFFYLCLNAQADFVAVENPLPMALAGLPKPTCFIHPSWYGVKYTKKTLYWLRNLPPLMAEIDFPQPHEFVRASRGKYRARTFPQVANAIAHQWGDYILDELNKSGATYCSK